MDKIEKFEKYLLNKRQHLKDMLLIIHDEAVKVYYLTELDTVDDIIHHFNIIVKSEISSGLGVDDK